MAPTRKALIFEDNPNIRLLLKLFFQKRGYEPVLVEDGVDAVALCNEHSPAIIVMDLIMPGKDGVEACSDVRKAGITVPIVMLTSKDYESDRARALKAGASVYMLKPFNPLELDRAIAPLVAR